MFEMLERMNDENKVSEEKKMSGPSKEGMQLLHPRDFYDVLCCDGCCSSFVINSSFPHEIRSCLMLFSVIGE